MSFAEKRVGGGLGRSSLPSPLLISGCRVFTAWSRNDIPRYDVMAFFRKCYAARSMLECCKESILQLVCIGNMATEAYAALSVTKCSKCALRTSSPVIPALSNINNIYTRPTPRLVSKFVALPRWPTKRLVAPSARPRQAERQQLISTATTPTS
jgi:hypothetical protein